MAHAAEGMTPFATPRGSIADVAPLLLAPSLLAPPSLEPPPLAPPSLAPLMPTLEAVQTQEATNWLTENAGFPEGFGGMVEPTTVTELVAHWFYCKAAGADKEPEVWEPFSREDSAAIEAAFIATGDVARDADPVVADAAPVAPDSPVVAVQGRRHDVHVSTRLMYPVFWDSGPARVRRATWFSRGAHESRFAPYEECVSARLEALYQQSAAAGAWHQELSLGEEAGTVILHSPSCLVHHPGMTQAWEHVNMPDDPSRPRQMRRGWDTMEGISVPPDEPDTVNHLVFVVHGIGPWCDLKFRKVNECVDDLRRMVSDLAGTHFSGARAAGRLGRVELLPISWHEALHGTAHDLDDGLRLITLPSTPLLRQFTNDTIVDVLYYTSPVYHKVILERVANDLNSIYTKFCARHPEFGGGVSLAGHSLGSLILFDLLCHQTGERAEQSSTCMAGSPSDDERFQQLLVSLELTQYAQLLYAQDYGSVRMLRLITEDDMSKLGMTRGAQRRLLNWQQSRAPQTPDAMPAPISAAGSYDAGSGQAAMHYPQLSFKPDGFYGFGSPIGLFLRVRGVKVLNPAFRLPTCPKVFNIYHPYDPVSFRIEPLIKPVMINVQPVLVPHHKGRKRMHLEIKDQMVRVGAEIKQCLLTSLQTFSSVYGSWVSSYAAAADAAQAESCATGHGDAAADANDVMPVGLLNGGRRIDYVLQEKPLESLNEYVFAFQSHLTYWESEDTMLLLMTEVLRATGIHVDSAAPQPRAPAAPAQTAGVQVTSPPQSETAAALAQTASGQATAPQSETPAAPVQTAEVQATSPPQSETAAALAANGQATAPQSETPAAPVQTAVVQATAPQSETAAAPAQTAGGQATALLAGGAALADTNGPAANGATAPDGNGALVPEVMQCSGVSVPVGGNAALSGSGVAAAPPALTQTPSDGAAARCQRVVGGCPVQIVAAGAAVGVDPTVSVIDRTGQPPPPPTSGFRRRQPPPTSAAASGHPPSASDTASGHPPFASGAASGHPPPVSGAASGHPPLASGVASGHPHPASGATGGHPPPASGATSGHPPLASGAASGHPPLASDTASDPAPLASGAASGHPPPASDTASDPAPPASDTASDPAHSASDRDQ